VRLRSEQCPPDGAWSQVLRLREAYPDRFINLVWERERYVDKVHYDLLIGGDAGLLSIGYCADDDVPWPTRGIQRVEECLVARVDGEAVDIGRAMTSLDYAWHTLHIGRHLIHMSLVGQELRKRRIEIDDDQLERVLAAFRVKRQLFSAASVDLWMSEHGVSHAQLSQHLRAEAARDELRRQIIGGEAACAAYFDAHRADFDRVQVARIFAPSLDKAEEMLSELRRAPEAFLVAARRCFLDQDGAADVFVTLQRSALDPEVAGPIFDTAAEHVVPRALSSGRGFEVVQVLRHLPATFDDQTREQIGDLLFSRWLDQRRAETRVEWFWGESEAADVPTVQL
jgi:putative peptide maturation system protein